MPFVSSYSYTFDWLAIEQYKVCEWVTDISLLIISLRHFLDYKKFKIVTEAISYSSNGINGPIRSKQQCNICPFRILPCDLVTFSVFDSVCDAPWFEAPCFTKSGFSNTASAMIDGSAIGFPDCFSWWFDRPKLNTNPYENTNTGCKIFILKQIQNNFKSC